MLSEISVQRIPRDWFTIAPKPHPGDKHAACQDKETQFGARAQGHVVLPSRFAREDQGQLTGAVALLALF